MSYVQGESRDQGSLFPVSLDELIGPDHVCRVITAFVTTLDLAGLGFTKARTKATGRPPYDPADLLALYLYGYLNRVRSSRRLERECQRNVEVMWLLKRLAPDHKTIAEFRRCNGPALKRAGAAFVQLCVRSGLVGGQWVAIDGTKFQAVASPKAIVEPEQRQQALQALEQRVAQYLQELDASDTQEGASCADPQAVRVALAELQRQQQALQHGAGGKRVVRTEPQAVVLKGKGPGYNVQTAVDAQHAIIVAHEVNAQAGDNACLQPMGEAAAKALSQPSFHLVADAGYANGEQAQALAEQGIEVHVPIKRSVNNHGDGALLDRQCFFYDPARDVHVCPAGALLHRKQVLKADKVVLYAADEQDCRVCTLKPRCTQAKRRMVSRHLFEDALQRIHARATQEAMRLRRSTVEHPYAALKYQIFEKPRFLLRGLEGAATEISLATLAYNFKRAVNALGPQALLTAIQSA
ncbi:MAG TPA: IS1182 family transposase [Aquabacterium sp.]|nr:IS1182 family transposase [Aquabacterium sp.]